MQRYYIVQFQQGCCYRKDHPTPIKAPLELVNRLGMDKKYTIYPCIRCGKLHNWKRSWWAYGNNNNEIKIITPTGKIKRGYIRDIPIRTVQLLIGRRAQLLDELLDLYTAEETELKRIREIDVILHNYNELQYK